MLFGYFFHAELFLSFLQISGYRFTDTDKEHKDADGPHFLTHAHGEESCQSDADKGHAYAVQEQVAALPSVAFDDVAIEFGGTRLS